MDGCLWTFLPGMQLFLFSFFFFSPPGPEHNGKPLILYCSVVELDQKTHHGLGSVPPASPSPVFTSSQHREVHRVGPLLAMAVKHVGWVRPGSPLQLRMEFPVQHQ